MQRSDPYNSSNPQPNPVGNSLPLIGTVEVLSATDTDLLALLDEKLNIIQSNKPDSTQAAIECIFTALTQAVISHQLTVAEAINHLDTINNTIAGLSKLVENPGDNGRPWSINNHFESLAQFRLDQMILVLLKHAEINQLLDEKIIDADDAGYLLRSAINHVRESKLINRAITEKELDKKIVDAYAMLPRKRAYRDPGSAETINESLAKKINQHDLPLSSSIFILQKADINHKKVTAGDNHDINDDYIIAQANLEIAYAHQPLYNVPGYLELRQTAEKVETEVDRLVADKKMSVSEAIEILDSTTEIVTNPSYEGAKQYKKSASKYAEFPWGKCLAASMIAISGFALAATCVVLTAASLGAFAPLGVAGFALGTAVAVASTSLAVAAIGAATGTAGGYLTYKAITEPRSTHKLVENMNEASRLGESVGLSVTKEMLKNPKTDNDKKFSDLVNNRLNRKPYDNATSASLAAQPAVQVEDDQEAHSTNEEKAVKPKSRATLQQLEAELVNLDIKIAEAKAICDELKKQLPSHHIDKQSKTLIYDSQAQHTEADEEKITEYEMADDNLSSLFGKRIVVLKEIKKARAEVAATVAAQPPMDDADSSLDSSGREPNSIASADSSSAAAAAPASMSTLWQRVNTTSDALSTHPTTENDQDNAINDRRQSF